MEILLVSCSVMLDGDRKLFDIYYDLSVTV